MTVQRVQQRDIVSQAHYEFELKRFTIHNEVYCPMCDMKHDNNTWCQANMNDCQGSEGHE